MSISKKFQPQKGTYQVTFTLPKEAAPSAKTVHLLGEFNNWTPEDKNLMKLKAGFYAASMELPAGGSFQFRYLIDLSIWENDHQADTYAPSPINASVENSVVVLESAAPIEVKQAKAAPKPKATSPKPVALAKSKVEKASAIENLTKEAVQSPATETVKPTAKKAKVEKATPSDKKEALTPKTSGKAKVKPAK